MLCCLLIALAGGPFLLWTRPLAGKLGGQDCCADNRRIVLAISVLSLALIALCAAMFLLDRFQPAPFRHICSLFLHP